MLYAQAKWVARVLSGRARLPPAADMLAKCRSFEAAHAAAGLPLRYLHCQVGKKRPTEKFHFQNNPGLKTLEASRVAGCPRPRTSPPGCAALPLSGGGKPISVTLVALLGGLARIRTVCAGRRGAAAALPALPGGVIHCSGQS